MILYRTMKRSPSSNCICSLLHTPHTPPLCANSATRSSRAVMILWHQRCISTSVGYAGDHFDHNAGLYRGAPFVVHSQLSEVGQRSAVNVGVEIRLDFHRVVVVLRVERFPCHLVELRRQVPQEGVLQKLVRHLEVALQTQMSAILEVLQSYDRKLKNVSAELFKKSL